MKTIVLCAIAVLGSVTQLPSQTTPGFPAGKKFLKGYERAVSGQVLSYWSFHPFAKQSLLSRATTGEMAIEWETEPVPADPAADQLHFLWIGAFSTGTSTADHDFDVFVNGRQSLTFRTFMGGVYDDWSVSGSDGVVLSYKHVWKDHVNDAHGYFCLTVPSGTFPIGEPLRLKIVGRASDTRDWYMTFAHAVRESALVRPLPIQVRGAGTIMQPIEVDIDFPGDRGTIDVSLAGAPPSHHTLKLGWNAIELFVQAVREDTPLVLEISIDSAESQRHTVTLRPITKRTIALLPHSHNDIGYSDVQTNVLDIQIQNIRDALRLIRKTKEYPPDARFKWNVEILWPVDSLLENAPPAEWDAFLQAVRDRSIGLHAMYVNPLTGIARPEVLMHLMDFARELRRRYGLSIPTAMITDIPGTSWGIVPALAHSGVRYFTSGPNAGDRIGHFREAWGDKPFYWLSPSGKDSVLMWVAGTGYSMFHATRTLRENQGFRQKLHEYLDRLDEISYPFELVQMRYSIYADNGMTDSTLSDVVREWNERTVSPVLRISTTEELFREFEERYGATLPSVAGDLTPYWEDGAASSAYELGLVQRASERLVQAGILATMNDPDSYDHRAFSNAWDAVNLWVEHTWGAWNSVSDPDEPGAVAQWNIKKDFAHTSESRTIALMNRSLGDSESSASEIIEVMNTASWTRTDVVSVPSRQGTDGDRVVDQDGKPVLSQRLSNGDLAFFAQDIPAFGSRRFRIVAGSPEPGGDARTEGLTLANGILALEVDPSNGTVRSLRSLAHGEEYVDQRGKRGLNEFIYVAGTSPASSQRDSITRVRVQDNGGLVASIVVESRSPGSNSIRRQYKLMHGMSRIDVINSIDKQPVRDKEAVYFRFPFAISHPVTRMDLGWGVIRPEIDQLPGSCKDYFSVQRWVDISESDRGITWSTVEAPLVELDEITDESPHNDGAVGWKTKTGPSSIVYSFVMNNYWHTNYKADQEGQSAFRYSIQPHGTYDALAAYRFGVERNQPLLVRSVDDSTPPPRLPFQVESDAASGTWIKPSEDGKGLLLRLYNPVAQATTVSVLWRDRKAHRIWKSNFLEEKTKELSGRIPLGSFEVITLWLER